MNKIKIIFILLICFAFTSCKTDYELQGIWFGAYTLYGNSSGSSPLPLLMDFSEDSVNFQAILRDKQERNYNTLALGYSIDGNNIVTDSFTFIILEETSDSLILSTPEDSIRKYIFKKVEPFISPKEPVFLHHAYALISTNTRDSIDFINDSMAINIGNDFYKGWCSLKWGVTEYKQMRFLILENMETQYFMIKELQDHSVYLHSQLMIDEYFNCIPITTKRDTSGLAGRWAYVYDETNNMPTPPTEDITFYDIKIHIQSSMVEVGKHHRKKIFSWELNSTNEIMILTSDDGSRKELWKIVEIGNDELILEQTDLFGSEVITLYLKREVK